MRIPHRVVRVACVLAGAPLWDLDTGVLAEVYRRCADARAQEEGLTPEEVMRWRRSAQQKVLAHWRSRLEEPSAVVGNDLSLLAVVKAMVVDVASWEAMASFYEEVMAQKEATERSLEYDPISALIRRRRTGRRMRKRSRAFPPQDSKLLIG
ncbi:uncharacterized protein LOC113230792 [Hyposmocoma kahamanoa]|uniref:uncharacterized protein LOC113230792 n=1 Tax=Hyposmocoma kahamanoa TaxID=1477025 RepID=UPI000E6D6E8C|nr:uncharacterized protein LOC113230792 [Hyposmocoma kahamanoa]